MLSEDKIMDVLEAFDLTRSYRSAAQLCGVDHHTVRRYVAARDAGLDPTSIGTGERSSLSDPFIEKIEEWVDRSQGRVRADVVHDKLCALGHHGADPLRTVAGDELELLCSLVTQGVEGMSPPTWWGFG